mmetsp:Transcript_69846/g.193350  ORF Transcript_69846/g.193350 Transcript_69846/m.193350 type:complete len:202 (-) Transcript_69846:384-989(-)
MQRFSRSHMLSGKWVIPLHLFRVKSSTEIHFPIEGGRLDKPMHLESDTSTSFCKFPTDGGNSFTSLHSRIWSCRRFTRSPMDSGSDSSALHLSRHNISKDFMFPNVEGRALRTLFPDPLCPPMQSFFKSVRSPRDSGRDDSSDASVKSSSRKFLRRPISSGRQVSFSHRVKISVSRFTRSQTDASSCRMYRLLCKSISLRF